MKVVTPSISVSVLDGPIPDTPEVVWDAIRESLVKEVHQVRAWLVIGGVRGAGISFTKNPDLQFDGCVPRLATITAHLDDLAGHHRDDTQSTSDH